MSYCRFIECDVYAYDSCEGGVQFYVARSVGEDLDRLCPTYNEAYQYAKTLRDKHGADIPDHAIYALRADALEEAERISGPGSAVAELRDENARLRELVKDALPFFDDDMNFCVGGDCFAIWECCEGESNDDCPAIRRMWERASELGVEVGK